MHVLAFHVLKYCTYVRTRVLSSQATHCLRVWVSECISWNAAWWWMDVRWVVLTHDPGYRTRSKHNVRPCEQSHTHIHVHATSIEGTAIGSFGTPAYCLLVLVVLVPVLLPVDHLTCTGGCLLFTHSFYSLVHPLSSIHHHRNKRHLFCLSQQNVPVCTRVYQRIRL